MIQLKDIKTIEELLILADDIIGENRECEKALFMALTTLLMTFHKEEERAWETVITLLLDTPAPKGPKNPQSPLDIRFSSVPNSMSLTYYRIYKLYPEHASASASGNLAYKLLKAMKLKE